MSYAELMVETADAHGLDWRLMPAIAVWESSAGRMACGGNAWGLGSCAYEYRFPTWEEGIAAVARTLSSPTYAGKATRVQLCIWVGGEPCLNEHQTSYAARVMATMGGLGE